MKPKQNYADIPMMDRCQTPPYAWYPLAKYIKPLTTILEPCAGDGYLADAMFQTMHIVLKGDILLGMDYLTYDYSGHQYDMMVTNPPYSRKFEFIARAYELGKPWAMLMPVETIGAAAAQRLFKLYGVQIIYLDKRIDFKMPNAGWGGSAQFPTAWFTWGLNLPHDMIFETIDGANKSEWKKANS